MAAWRIAVTSVFPVLSALNGGAETFTKPFAAVAWGGAGGGSEGGGGGGGGAGGAGGIGSPGVTPPLTIVGDPPPLKFPAFG